MHSEQVHCLRTCVLQWKASALTDMSGRTLFNDEISASLASAIVPSDTLEHLLGCRQVDFLLRTVAVRTATIDRLLVSSGYITAIFRNDIQVVSIGAGMDTRAWRLPVPDRQVRWFDVDTSAALEYKQQLLAARPTLHSRCCVKADFTDAAQVEQGLLQAGFSKDTPTVWVLELSLRYMTAQQQSDLAVVLRRLSAGGSRVIASGPPSEQHWQRLVDLGVTYDRNIQAGELLDVMRRFIGAGWAVQEIFDPKKLEGQYGIKQLVDLFFMFNP